LNTYGHESIVDAFIFGSDRSDRAIDARSDSILKLLNFASML